MESVNSEITVLENSIRCLYLEPCPELETTMRATAVGNDLTEHHNTIRTSLKNICGNEGLSANLNISDVHRILTKPFTVSGDITDDAISNILSYLKMLSEACPPLQQSNVSSSPADVFWMDILEPMITDVFKFMNASVFKKCFVKLSSVIPGKSCDQNDSKTVSSHGTGYAFHHQLGVLLKAVRILLVFLKRALLSLSTAENSEVKFSVAETLTTLTSLMDPLRAAKNRTDFDVGLDIRCNIGVGICYSVQYLCHQNKAHIQSFYNSIFSSSPETSVYSSHSWSESEKLILDVVLSSDLNKLAVAFGVLNTWLDQEHDKDLYLSTASNVLKIEHGVKEAVNLGSSRVLEIWTDKLARESVPLFVRQHVAPLFPSLEFFCYMYMPAHIDAVKNCCRNIISGLAKIYDTLDAANFPVVRASSTESRWIPSILVTILEKEAHIKWIALSCVVKNTKKSLVVLDLEPTLPEQLLTTQRSYKSAANDVYVSLMSYHFETIGRTAEWQRVWIDPLFMSQPHQESNWTQKKTIISIILNSEKLRLKQFQGMILPLLKNVMKRMNSNSSTSDSSETSLLAVETIKLAYELKITLNPDELNLDTVRDSHSAPRDSFRGLVPRSVLNSWLWSGNPQIRIAGFALLVETKKTSDVISPQDFESVKIFFKYNLLSQNPAFRQQFFSYYKKFVRRIKDGISLAQRKMDTATVQTYQDFLRWLWNFLTEEEGLFVGANFARRCLALECLFDLTQNFQNFEVFGVKTTGNMKYLKWLTDSYENNKILALEIIVWMPAEEFDDDKFCSSLYDHALSLCKSVKPPDSVTGRYLMTLLMRKSCNVKYTAYSILESMYAELENLLNQIQKTTLVQVASENPLYGCVRCIRMILANSEDYKNQDNTQKYRDYVDKLLKLCFTVNDILFPVLGSSAPEGFLPEKQEFRPQADKLVVRSVAAQMLLVCAWRTMKEICLLMSDMCCWFVMEGETHLPSFKKTALIPGAMNHLLKLNQVSAIGEHLLYLLKNLMHRGVFEQVFVGFKQLSTRLWKSTAPTLSSLPEKWLKDAMDQEHLGAKSITRRSAGLPFIFQALLSAESDNESFLQEWVQRLLIFDEHPEMTPIRIHSMNVLRGLFRDATFSSAMMPFVPFGLRMAFRGLKSADWTERNSGLMLYGAVMRRTFGPKLNLMNAPTFFRKFPQMYDFLLNELDTCIQLMEMRGKEKKLLVEKSKLDPSLSDSSNPITCDFTFHLLLLLSSFTSSGRLEDTHFKLSEFIPRIRKCGESDDMEVRKLSAKALIPFLTSLEDKVELGKCVIRSIHGTESCPQNHLHGKLFQFLTVVRHLVEDVHVDADNSICCLSEEFVSVVGHISKFFAKAAPSIFEVLIEIVLSLKAPGIRTESLLSARTLIEKAYGSRFGRIKVRNTVPGLPVADAAIANCTIKYLLNKQELDSEKIYNYFTDNTGNLKSYSEQFVGLLHEDIEISEELTKVLILSDSCSPEAVVLAEAIIGKYIQLCNTEFMTYPATELELHYLSLIERIAAESFDQTDTGLIRQLLERLGRLCEEEDGKELTTLPIKASAFRIIAKLVFSTCTEVSAERKAGFCNTLLHWSGSDVDDDLRFAVGDSFHKIPFDNMISLSAVNQAKIWSSILMLAQDDESSLRQILHRKIVSNNGQANCDRKSLELLLEIYLKEFFTRNPIEGLLVLIGLLMREDHQVEANAADDDNEDRIFDKSEMNMYFEHRILIRTIQLALDTSPLIEKQHIRSTLDVCLLERHVIFFADLTNKPSASIDSNDEQTIRKLVTDFIKSDVPADSKKYDDVPNELVISNVFAVKCVISEYLQAFLTKYS